MVPTFPTGMAQAQGHHKLRGQGGLGTQSPYPLVTAGLLQSPKIRRDFLKHQTATPRKTFLGLA